MPGISNVASLLVSIKREEIGRPPFPTAPTCVASSVCRPECIAEVKELPFTELRSANGSSLGSPLATRSQRVVERPAWDGTSLSNCGYPVWKHTPL